MGRLGPSLPLLIGLLIVAGTLLLYSRGSAEAHDWVTVAHDANYDIDIDRASTVLKMLPRSGTWVTVVETFYQTRHKQTRLHKGKEFNREVVNSFVMCDSLWFTVKSVTMSMNGGRPVSRQMLSWQELYRQKWHRVEMGTAEEIAARAACHFATK
jgi:hypothetical protein